MISDDRPTIKTLSFHALTSSRLSTPSDMRARKRTHAVLGVSNAIAIALYEKFGFEVEGTHRRLAFREGEYIDAYSMARLKP
jgi:L-phenylalanine/L-methionine N-acetyltransferase